MARLSREGQRAYEEELEYQRNQPINILGKSHPSAMDRIVNAVKGAGRKLHEANESPTGRAIRGFAERVNAQGGLGEGCQQPQSYGGTRSRAFRAVNGKEPSINKGSSVRPGSRPRKGLLHGGPSQQDEGLGFNSDRGL